MAKKTVYTVEYVSIDHNDNYLYSDVHTYGTKEEADKAFKENCECAFADAKNPCESNDEEDFYEVTESRDKNFYEVNRDDGEFDVFVKLLEFEIDV